MGAEPLRISHQTLGLDLDPTFEKSCAGEGGGQPYCEHVERADRTVEPNPQRRLVAARIQAQLKQRSLFGSVRLFQEKCTDDDRACNVLRHAPIAEIVKVQVVT